MATGTISPDRASRGSRDHLLTGTTRTLVKGVVAGVPVLIVLLGIFAALKAPGEAEEGQRSATSGETPQPVAGEAPGPTEPVCNAPLHFTASLTFAPAGVDASTIQAAIDELNAYVPLEDRCVHPVPTFDTNFSGPATTPGNGTNELLFGPIQGFGQDDTAGLASIVGVQDGYAVDGSPHYFPIFEADIDIDGTLPPDIYGSEEYICVVAHEFAHAMGYEHEDKIYRGRSSGGLSLGHCGEAKFIAHANAYCGSLYETHTLEFDECKFQMGARGVGEISPLDVCGSLYETMSSEWFDCMP